MESKRSDSSVSATNDDNDDCLATELTASAKIQPIKEPKRSGKKNVSNNNKKKKPCEYEDPDHPSFWKCKYKLNPLYKGPADATKPESQVVVMVMWWCV